MVKLNKIYTKTGDGGTSGLVDGTRRRKDDLRFGACGTVDETNAAIGLACCHVQDMEDMAAMLRHVQNDLFDLGADLATPIKEGEKPDAALRIGAAQIAWLEGKIDRLNAQLSPLRSFILPGGRVASSHLHLARTIVRRAERDIVAVEAVEAINHHALCYINRLSDLLFVAARWINDKGKSDIEWVPGQNR